MADTTFIYALCEPGSKIVRYIGKADNLSRRLRQHLNDSPKRKTHLGYWIRGLLSVGQAPVMLNLREVPDSIWEIYETGFICRAKEMGYDLVNSSEGGRGGRGKAITDEHKEKLRRPKSLEHRRNLSLNNPRYFLGKNLSEEHCANISAALTGIERSPEHCANLSLAKLGDKNPMFGKKQSKEAIEKRKASMLLIKDQMSASLKAAWARRKAVSTI